MEVVPPDERGLVDLAAMEELLERYRDRPLKIGAFTACSNVTGVRTPVHALARLMHRHGGYCFVDYAASAPYVDIDMHPADPLEKLDAVYFSPHKFLGGPGSAGSAGLRLAAVPQPGAGPAGWGNGQLDQPLEAAQLRGRHRGARGRRDSRLPPDHQGGAGGDPQGCDGHLADPGARTRADAAAPSRAADHSAPAHPRRPPGGPAGRSCPSTWRTFTTTCWCGS